MSRDPKNKRNGDPKEMEMQTLLSSQAKISFEIDERLIKAKNQLIKAKNQLIKAKDQLIKAKDQLIKAKNQLIS